MKRTDKPRITPVKDRAWLIVLSVIVLCVGIIGDAVIIAGFSRR
jgi:hypothetical protein